MVSDSSLDPGFERARQLSDRGLVLEAIEDVTRAVESRPSDAGPRLIRAQFHLQRRNYALALADLDAAKRLLPGDPAPILKRAEMFCLIDRAVDAERELSEAVKATPGAEGLRLALLGVLVLRGRAALARAEIARLLKSRDQRVRDEARFQRGALAFKLRRPGLGAKDFKALIKELGEADPLAKRARFYWTASRSIDPGFRRRTGMKALKKTAKKTARLYLCGLGIFPPYTASLDVLNAIGQCDILFNNVAGPEVRSLLAEFCDEVRPASYQAWQDEPKWADKIFTELDKGRTVAFVTRGHPLVFGGLAVELIRRCKAQGVEHECFASVSSIDHLLAYTGKGLGDDFGGITAIDWPAFRDARVHNTALPLLLCFYAGRKNRAEMTEVRKGLERFYPGALACWMFGPKYDDPPAVIRIDELDSVHDSLHPSLMLYVPACREEVAA